VSDHTDRFGSWKLEALGRLAAGLAHELNNVLQDFVSNVELAMDDLPAGSDGHGHAERAIEVALQAARLADRMAMFSRTLGATEDLAAMLTELHSLLQRTVGNAATVTLDISSPLPPVRTDIERLRTALVHLVCDTVQRLPRGSAVRISAAPSDDGAVVIAVAGHGWQADRPRLHPLVEELGGKVSPPQETGETVRIEIRAVS
jgi:signal transduction histidine kinase